MYSRGEVVLRLKWQLSISSHIAYTSVINPGGMAHVLLSAEWIDDCDLSGFPRMHGNG